MGATSHPYDSNLNLPVASRRERRSAETRERLFRSALQLFAQKGFEETTVEDITEAADVGKGTFFNYFPSKDHILIAFSDMQIGKLEQAVAGLRSSEQPLQEFMRSLVLKMTEEPIRNPGLIRALLRGYLSTTAVREMMILKQNHAHGLHKQMIEIGQGRGEVRSDIPAAEIAHFFRQTILGTLLIWSVTGDATLRERIDSALQILWRGIAPRNSAVDAGSELR
ncbi:MAG TPA: TetR family transcriptional regulator [Candidatus Sulfotelmatobacter sp.]|jgi:AcrR family transcriptional regulator|nr:TetR family transcriptional regulator [Candidatus Sulfotelmatobacter sp.]